MRYPGGKGGAGVYQTIINHIPPHDIYIEAFTGGGNIFERKTPAAKSILIERDTDVAHRWKQRAAPHTEIVNGDAVPWLRDRDWQGNEFVYLDPPYVLSTRTKKNIYQFEMSDADHLDLLSVLAAMTDRQVKFMLSGYRCAIYDDAAAVNGWHRVDFQAMTRRGPATESIWMNYDASSVIAEYSYAGHNFRERERIKRKVARWIRRLQLLEPKERAALLSAISKKFP